MLTAISMSAIATNGVVPGEMAFYMYMYVCMYRFYIYIYLLISVHMFIL